MLEEYNNWRQGWDIMHPDLSARMSEKSKLADHTTRRVFLPGDPVMVKDYRNCKRQWIKGVIQDRLVPVTYRVKKLKKANNKTLYLFLEHFFK